MFRLDRITTPPGLIRRGKTYTALIDTGTLYLVYTGPAGREETRAVRGAKGVGARIMLNAYEKQIVAAEKEISETPLNITRARPDTITIPLLDITNCVRGRYNFKSFTQVKLETKTNKLVLRFGNIEFLYGKDASLKIDEFIKHLRVK